MQPDLDPGGFAAQFSLGLLDRVTNWMDRRLGRPDMRARILSTRCQSYPSATGTAVTLAVEFEMIIENEDGNKPLTLRRHVGILKLSRWGKVIELPCVDFTPSAPIEASEAGIPIAPGGDIRGVIRFEKEFDAIPPIPPTCKTTILLEFRGFRKPARARLPIQWSQIPVAYSKLPLEPKMPLDVVTQKPIPPSPPVTSSPFVPLDERSVAVDTCRRLVRDARAVAVTFLDSASKTDRDIYESHWETLFEFYSKHGYLLGEPMRTNLIEGIIAGASDGLVMGINPAEIGWRQDVHLFVAMMDMVLGNRPEGLRPLKMEISYVKVWANQIGEYRRFTIQVLVKFHNRSSQPLTVYRVSVDIRDGHVAIETSRTPRPHTTRYTRKSGMKPVDMERGILVPPGELSEAYWIQVEFHISAALNPAKPMLRIGMSAMNQLDSWEDFALPWSQLLEVYVAELRDANERSTFGEG